MYADLAEPETGAIGRTALPGDLDRGWQLVRYAAALTKHLANAQEVTGYAQDAVGTISERSTRRAELIWRPSVGWESRLETGDPRADVLDLYLPIASAHARRPIAVGHLGQSLDGCIATASGDSCFVTGPTNFLHLHRMRALCDAIIVGARTAELDNPRLTTRLVTGPNPTRVILDPRRRLDGSQGVFTDGAAPTLRVSLPGNSAPRFHATGVEELMIGGADGRLDLRELMRRLAARGCHRILIEGGGVTVTHFLLSGVLDRLHLTVAPLLIGVGSRALSLPGTKTLAECMRLAANIFRMGEDVLYDCPLRERPAASHAIALRRVR